MVVDLLVDDGALAKGATAAPRLKEVSAVLVVPQEVVGTSAVETPGDWQGDRCLVNDDGVGGDVQGQGQSGQQAGCREHFEECEGCRAAADEEEER